MAVTYPDKVILCVSDLSQCTQTEHTHSLCLHPAVLLALEGVAGNQPDQRLISTGSQQRVERHLNISQEVPVCLL